MGRQISWAPAWFRWFTRLSLSDFRKLRIAARPAIAVAGFFDLDSLPGPCDICKAQADCSSAAGRGGIRLEQRRTSGGKARWPRSKPSGTALRSDSVSLGRCNAELAPDVPRDSCQNEAVGRVRVRLYATTTGASSALRRRKTTAIAQARIILASARS